MGSGLFEKIGIDKLAVMLTDHFGPRIGGAMVKVMLAVVYLALVVIALGAIAGVVFASAKGIRAMQPPSPVKAPPPAIGEPSVPPRPLPTKPNPIVRVHKPQPLPHPQNVSAPELPQSNSPVQSGCNISGGVNNGTAQNCSFGVPAAAPPVIRSN